MLVIKFKFQLYRQTCLEQKVISSSTFWEESGGISFTLSNQLGMEDGDRGRVFCNALVHWDLALPGSRALCWSVWQILYFCLSTETTSMSRDCKNILTELRRNTATKVHIALPDTFLYPENNFWVGYFLELFLTQLILAHLFSLLMASASLYLILL